MGFQLLFFYQGKKEGYENVQYPSAHLFTLISFIVDNPLTLSMINII